MGTRKEAALMPVGRFLLLLLQCLGPSVVPLSTKSIYFFPKQLLNSLEVLVPVVFGIVYPPVVQHAAGRKPQPRIFQTPRQESL